MANECSCDLRLLTLTATQSTIFANLIPPTWCPDDLILSWIHSKINGRVVSGGGAEGFSEPSCQTWTDVILFSPYVVTFFELGTRNSGKMAAFTYDGVNTQRRR